MIALTLATLGWLGGAVVLDAQEDRVLLGWVHPVALDSDGPFRMTVRLVEDGATRDWPLAAEALEQARFLPGDRMLATVDGALVLIEDEAARTLDTQVVGAVGASPDGRHLVYCKGAAPDLEVWRITDGGVPRQVTRGMAPSWSPAVADDGRVVFTSARSGVPALWLVEDEGTPRQLTNRGAPDPTALAPFPTGLGPTLFDGERVVFEAQGRIHVYDARGQHRRALPGVAPHWRRDGTMGLLQGAPPRSVPLAGEANR